MKFVCGATPTLRAGTCPYHKTASLSIEKHFRVGREWRTPGVAWPRWALWQGGQGRQGRQGTVYTIPLGGTCHTLPLASDTIPP